MARDIARDNEGKIKELPKIAIVQYSDKKYDIFKNVKKKLRTKYIRLLDNCNYDFEAFFPSGWFPGCFIAEAGK